MYDIDKCCIHLCMSESDCMYNSQSAKKRKTKSKKKIKTIETKRTTAISDFKSCLKDNGTG